MSLFRSGCIRGPVGERVTADLALALGRVFGTAHDDPVVLGRDGRESSPVLADALSAGVRECGTDVVDVGRVPAPALARSVPWLDGSVGVMVTGGHNPAGYNGFDLRGPSGRPFDGGRRHGLTERFWSEAFELTATSAGTVGSPPRDPTERYREALAGAVSLQSPLRVVVDVGDGLGRVTADALTDLGCTVTTLQGGQEGPPPSGSPDPSEVRCEQLRQVVAGTEADLGIAHGSAAGRAMAVTESGRFVRGDTLLALFARESAGDGDEVAVPIDTSLAVEREVESVGGSVVRTKVGASYVTNRASDPEVAFGGEPCGNWVWPDEAPTRDGPLAACKLAATVAASGSLDDLVDGIAEYPLRREAVPVDSPGDVLHSVHESAREAYGDGAVSSIDGIHVDREDGWFLIRASGTEDAVRLTAEAEKAGTVERYLDRARDLVRGVTATADAA